MVLFIEDHNLIKGEFIELINSLISSGEIPGLYSPDEVERIFPNPEDIRRDYYGSYLRLICIKLCI